MNPGDQQHRSPRTALLRRRAAFTAMGAWSIGLAALADILASGGIARADDAAPAAAPAKATAAPGEARAPGGAGAKPKSPPRVPEPPPIDQQPYRVLVALGIAPDAGLAGSLGERLPQELKNRIDSRLGPLWEARVEASSWLAPGRKSVLEALDEAALNEKFLAAGYDKVFLATVEADGAATRISAREWDRNSQSATAVTSNLNYERRVLADVVLAELLTHFRPYAEIEEVSEDGYTVELRLRGGELLPPDDRLRPIAEGAYLRPYLRQLDRKKELRNLQSLPWTYLQVTEVDRGRLTAQLRSAFAGVLSGSRRRTEQMAIAVKIRFDETSVRIYPHGQNDNPLSGTRVEVMNRQPSAEDPVADRRTLYSNRAGEVVVPADPEHPLQWMYVMSGKSILAIVPYIPGEQPHMELEVADDGPRLAVEGEIAILEAELIEIVARREVTIARALGHAKAGESEQAERLLSEVKNLPTREQLKERLDRIRLPAIAAARATKNRTAESRIAGMCQQLSEQIDQHLDPERITAFQNDIRELREALK